MTHSDVDYTNPEEVESPEAWLAKVDAAVAAVPPPATSFEPALPGVQPDAGPPSTEDVGVREARELSGERLALFRDALPVLLPLAVRLVRLHLSPGKQAHLHAALDALGLGEVRREGEAYLGLTADGDEREYVVRQGQVYVPEDRARVLAALADVV